MGQNSTHPPLNNPFPLAHYRYFYFSQKHHPVLFLPLHTAGKIALPSALLQFWDLGGQRGIRSIWPKYYDDCHAVVYVVDAVDHERLSEGWEVFGAFTSSFLNAKQKKQQGALKRKRGLPRLGPLRPADPRRPAPPAGEQAGQPRFALSCRNSA